jgi:hypothetical protein
MYKLIFQNTPPSTKQTAYIRQYELDGRVNARIVPSNR